MLIYSTIPESIIILLKIIDIVTFLWKWFFFLFQEMKMKKNFFITKEMKTDKRKIHWCLIHHTGLPCMMQHIQVSERDREKREGQRDENGKKRSILYFIHHTGLPYITQNQVSKRQQKDNDDWGPDVGSEGGKLKLRPQVNHLTVLADKIKNNFIQNVST